MKTRLLVLVLLLMATWWLGARSLDADPIWSDEERSLYDAGIGIYSPIAITDIWSRVAERNPWHTPAYFILLHGWSAVVGDEPPALRALSLLFGLLTLAWTYRLGTLFVSPQVGIIAAAILGSSLFFVYYTHELRMYTLIALTGVSSAALYRLCLDHSGNRLLTLLFFVTALLALYTHYFAALPLFAIGVYHLLFARKDRVWWWLTGVLVALALAFTPWLGVLSEGLTRAEAAEWIHERALSSRQTLALLLMLFSNQTPALLLASGALALLALVRERRGWQLWFLPLVMLGTLLLVNSRLQIMHEGRLRYLITLLPFTALLMAWGVTQLRRWRWAGAAGAALWIGTGVSATLSQQIAADLDGYGYDFPVHRIARTLSGHNLDGDLLIGYIPDDEARWMYARNAAYYWQPLGINTLIVERNERSEREAREVIFTRERVWLAVGAGDVPRGLAALESDIRARFTLCGRLDDGHTFRLRLYARDAIACTPDITGEPPLVTFANGVLVVRAHIQQTETSIAIRAAWQTPTPFPPDVYSVTWQLIDAGGALVAQHDMGLPAESFSIQTVTLALNDAAPGDYALRIGLYDWRTGERVTANTAIQAEGDLPLLTRLQLPSPAP